MMPTAISLGRPVELLLVEDSPSDAGLAQEALQQATVAVNVHRVEDGEQALQFLHRAGAFQGKPRPDLVLLDLNLPKINGCDVLAEIRSDPRFAVLPVIVLTTSAAPEDVQQAYKLRANCYLQKPVDLIEFCSAMRSLEAFWLTCVTLPVCDD